MEKVRFQVSGCAAHSRLVPLLPSDWIDESYEFDSSASSSGNSSTSTPEFLWENAPRSETRDYRDGVMCYSHLPNGTAILDDKWALARLLSPSLSKSAMTKTCTETRDEETFVSSHFAALESHCFRGISGFESFCQRVNMWGENDESCTRDCPTGGRFSDLLDAPHKVIPPPSPPPPPRNLWVVKDANSNGAGGIWVVCPQNANDFVRHKTTPLLPEHRYVAQRYAWPPVLYGGRKFHVRVYGLVTCDGRAFVHRRAFLHVANELFSYPSSSAATASSDGGAATMFCNAVHITNCCANSHDESKFAGEICADMEAIDIGEPQHHQGETCSVSLANFYSSIAASVAELSRRAFPFLRGGQANNGFEYLGMDFILSHDDNQTPIAYMLEVNAPPSQDTATGLEHAERLHNDVIRDILTLWVFPKVDRTSKEQPGGWKCVYDERMYHVEDPPLIVPSKASILNKIRWAIYERKNSKLYDDETTTTTPACDENDASGFVVVNGKESSTSTKHSLSANAVATFARSQFPYFADHVNDSSSSPSTLLPRPPAQIYFENAGGAQVPQQVIRAITASLLHRNRTVDGSRAKQAARRTLSTIMSASLCQHLVFLGANASSLFETLARRYVESGLLSSKDEVVVCTENHLANVTPWLLAARSVGATVKWWHVDGLEHTMITRQEEEDGICRSQSLRDLLSSKTRVLAVSHASNVLGQLRDLKSICELARKQSGGYTHVVADGVAAIPHSNPSVSATKVDWYAISCHKLFGPHIGALCGRREVVKGMLGVCSHQEGDDVLYKRIETGTISYEACAGVEGLGTYFCALARFDGQNSSLLQTRNQSTGARQDRSENPSPQLSSIENSDDEDLTEGDVLVAYNRISLSETSLMSALYGRLKSCDNVRIIESTETTCAARLPVVSFLHRCIASSVIVRACSAAGITCRQSSFLSTPTLQAWFGFGAGQVRETSDDSSSHASEEGVVRVSLAHYNTVKEVDYLMDTLESIPEWWKS